MENSLFDRQKVCQLLDFPWPFAYTDRQKVCQSMTFGPVTDFLSVSGTFLESLTDKKSVSNSKMMPLTDKKSVSEKFSKYIIQKTLFRRDKYKQCIAEMLLELNGRCS